MSKLIAIAFVASMLASPAHAVTDAEMQRLGSAAARMHGCTVLHNWTTSNRAPPAADLFEAGFCAGQLNAAMMYLPLLAGATYQYEKKTLFACRIR
jgi:hypothetical protein